MKTEYSKLRTKVLGLIDGMTMMEPKYHILNKVIHSVESIHNNYRKDGQPEFSHQIEMLAMALNFHTMLSKPLDVYLAIVLHDTLEDYPQHVSDLQVLLSDYPEVVGYSMKLSKVGKLHDTYFSELGNCEVCSVVKLIDRVHNLSTAPNVFSVQKITEYCNEVHRYFIPILYRTAKVKFNQRAVYEVLKTMLITQCSTIQNMILSMQSEMKK